MTHNYLQELQLSSSVLGEDLRLGVAEHGHKVLRAENGVPLAPEDVGGQEAPI